MQKHGSSRLCSILLLPLLLAFEARPAASEVLIVAGSASSSNVNADVKPFHQVWTVEGDGSTTTTAIPAITTAEAAAKTAPASPMTALSSSATKFTTTAPTDQELMDRLDNESYFDVPQRSEQTRDLQNQQHQTNESTSWFFRIQRFAAETLLPLYVVLLGTYPMLTKSVTACLIGGLGDLLAQVLERQQQQQQRTSSTLASSWDIRRLLSVAGEGLFVSGPLMHLSYEFLDTHLPVESPDNTPLQKWLLAALQVLFDCCIMDCVFVATLMLTTALLEGRSIRQTIVSEFLSTDAYWNALQVSWAGSFLFAPLQCCLFRFIPIQFRVFAMNLQDVLWNASISFVAHRNRKE